MFGRSVGEVLGSGRRFKVFSFFEILKTFPNKTAPAAGLAPPIAPSPKTDLKNRPRKNLGKCSERFLVCQKQEFLWLPNILNGR